MSPDLPRLTPTPSIYEFLAGRADAAGRLPADLLLPDEPPRSDADIRWAPGAMDGVFGHHAGGGDTAAAADRLARLVARAADRPTGRRLRRLLAAAADDDLLHAVDPMIERLGALGPDVDAVRRVGRWLAATGVTRGQVKLGVALLGMAGLGDAVGVVRTLGAHDELTLYAAVALGNGLPDGGESELWALAVAVDGWGRIHCVERLAGTTDPQIKRWILRTGFRNSVMDEYLAHTAATTGDLLGALRGEPPGGPVDRELLDAAGDIVFALVEGGPAEDLDDYDDGADAVEVYLDLLHTRAETLDDVLGVLAVRDFLARPDGWDARTARGWTATRRTALEAACAEILARPAWRGVAEAALGSPDAAASWRGNRVLRALGVRTFEHHVLAIRTDPLGPGWFEAWQQAGPESGAGPDAAERLVELAREVLPLETVGTGEATALGLGPEWRAHASLDWTLQSLDAHPGLGGDLLLVGLRSPIVRGRNLALGALEAWPREQWPDGAEEVVAQAARTDPDPRVRERAAALAGPAPTQPTAQQ